MSTEKVVDQIEYFPLSLYKRYPKDFKDDTYELRNHIGKPKHKKLRRKDDKVLPENCLISRGTQNQPILLYCVTMYNEPFLQLIQTLAGVYRSYYELCNIDDSFVGRAHITIIADGYDKIDTEFLR
jgi:hypothetical protein